MTQRLRETEGNRESELLTRSEMIKIKRRRKRSGGFPL